MPAMQIESLPSRRRLSLWWYRSLLRLRPSQLGQFLKHCFGIRRRYVRTGEGALLWVDPASQFGVDLMREGIYEVKMSRLIQTVLRKQDTFLDVGANEGYFSVLASPRAGKVFALEPQSRLQAVIRENAEINKATNLFLHHVALSDREGKMDLYLRPDMNTGASSFFPKWRLGRTHESVEVLSLDGFLKRHQIDRVRLLKADCEGAEPLIFAGAGTTLRERRIDFIAVEFHPTICGEAQCAEIDRKLREAGYELTSANGHWIYHLPGLQAELKPLGSLQTVPPWGA